MIKKCLSISILLVIIFIAACSPQVAAPATTEASTVTEKPTESTQQEQVTEVDKSL